MERLTYVTENGTVLFSPDGKDAVTIIDISEMGDTEYLEQIADTLANREVAAMFYERKYKEKCKELKAYEDTGLTPEQIREIDKLYTEMCRKLAEYKKDELEGQLLRLPCKVGDTVYFITSAFSLLSEPKEEVVRKIEITRGDITIRTENRTFALKAIGNTVFSSHEKAEAKLAEMENNHE